MKPTIQFPDFAKVEIRIGRVVEASIPEGSKKLIRQVVDFGDEIGRRVIFSGILEWYQPEDLIDRQLPYVINLEPRKMPFVVETPQGEMREESQGMLLAAAPADESGNQTCVLLLPEAEVVNGTLIV